MNGQNAHPSTNGPPTSARWRRGAGTFTNILPAAAATSPRIDARIVAAIMKEPPPLE